MGVNRDKPDRWNADVARSVDYYNDWFIRFAPQAYRETRVRTTESVKRMIDSTDKLRTVTPAILMRSPKTLADLRSCTCPPIARDRLIGLAGVPAGLVDRMEDQGLLPVRLAGAPLEAELRKLCAVVERLRDSEIFPWLATNRDPTEAEEYRAATIVADRLCGAATNPIIRNSQEERQLRLAEDWLNARQYQRFEGQVRPPFNLLPPGTYARHMVVPGSQPEASGGKDVKVQVDLVVMPRDARPGDLPLCIEAKSAGDFTNPNKRRKEEATKFVQLRAKHGDAIRYILLLCGYFNAAYLGYTAAEGLDWVWEHRLEDLAEFKL